MIRIKNLGSYLHYMPQDRPSADFDHWLGPHRGLFGEARSQAPGQNYNLHRMDLSSGVVAGDVRG
jgi:hypothetical protein